MPAQPTLTKNEDLFIYCRQEIAPNTYMHKPIQTSQRGQRTD